jgi:hypothetical protein
MQKAKRRRSNLFVAFGVTAAWFLAQWARGTETTLGAVTGGALLLAAGAAAIIQGLRQRNRLDTPDTLNVRDS